MAEKRPEACQHLRDASDGGAGIILWRPWNPESCKYVLRPGCRLKPGFLAVAVGFVGREMLVSLGGS